MVWQLNWKKKQYHGQAENLSKNIVCVATAIVLFIVIKIGLRIVISILNLVAELPILKQFNEIGGLAYGIIRGLIIALACILIMGIITKINPNADISKQIENTYITKCIYNNVIKF